MPQSSRVTSDEIAIRALAFLAADPDRLDRFLAVSGLSPGDIRTAAAEPGFLAGVMQHIMEDERLARAFAEEAALTPEALGRAAQALGSGAWERDTP